MRRIKVSRVLCLLLVFALASGALTGCGLIGKRKKPTALAKIDKNTTYAQIESPLDTILKSAESNAAGDGNAAKAPDDELSDDMGADRFNFIASQAANGRYYVLYSDLENADNVFLCSFDEKGKKEVTIPIPSSEDGGVTHFCVMPDDSIILLDNRYVAQKDVFVRQMGRYTVENKDKDNKDKDKDKDKPVLKEVWKVTVSDEEDFYPNGLVSTENDIYILTETGVIIYDSKDGAAKLKSDLPKDFYGNICKTPDGKVLLAASMSPYAFSYTIDPATGKYQENKYQTPGSFYGDAFSSGFGEYDFCIADASCIYGFKIGEPEPVKLFDFIGSDLEIESIIGFSFLSAETAVLMYYNMDFGSEAALFKKAPDQQGDKVALSIACTYADSKLSKAIVNFNKKNDRYRVVLKEYPYDDEGNNTLNMEIAAGNIPDMLCVSEDMPVESYAAKGMFVDLEPMFSKDEEIAARDYLDNVINASRIDGKMYFISPAFNVIGLIGKKKDFGDTKGVTTTQIENMIKERGLSYDTAMGVTSRQDMLSWVMFCAMEEYVDWDKGTCSFGSESFINLLKFCNKFPKKVKYENVDWSKFETAMREGKQLARDGYIYNIESYMVDRYGYVGDEIVFMGYPGNGENGPVIMNELAVAIMHNSDHPEGCWEFLREFYLDDYQQSVDNAFPVSTDALQILAEKAMNPKVYTYTDVNGKQVSEPETGSIFLNDKEIKLPVPTQKDIDFVMDILRSLENKASVDSKITEIINEESGAYFAGQKGAEETADIIQSRVKVYISETK